MTITRRVWLKADGEMAALMVSANIGVAQGARRVGFGGFRVQSRVSGTDGPTHAGVIARSVHRLERHAGMFSWS